jgi:hypothetical protein
MYRRAKAVHGDALLGKGDVKGAIEAVSFVYEIIKQGRQTNMELHVWCTSNAFIRAQAVDGRAKLQANKIDGVDGAVRALERANTLDRLYQKLFRNSQIGSQRFCFTQDYIRAFAHKLPFDKLEMKIADALYRSDALGDSLQSALLVAIHGEYLAFADDRDRGAKEIEASYQELLHLGAMFETLDLCKRASAFLDTPRHSIWKSRRLAHMEDLLRRCPDPFKAIIAEQLR